MLYNAVNSMADELPTYNFIRPRKLAVWLGKLLDALVPHTGDFVTVVSDSLRDFLKFKGVEEARLKVVPAGVDLDMFARGDGQRIREQHGLVGKPLVMYTGTLDQFQRIDYLLQAMQTVLPRVPEARLMFVCNIPHKANEDLYLSMARDLGIDQKIIFVNSVPLGELPDYLAAADVAVVPRPDCPGHPVKLLNYMAAAKAIVSFEGGAKGLHHMYNGYLAKDHDTQALGAGIAHLLEHPDYRRILGAHAHSTIEGHFDWDTLAKGILIIYRMMLEERSDEAMHKALSTHVRDSYVLRFVERRDPAASGPAGVVRGEDRRKRQLSIDFPERRKVAFNGSAPLPQKHHEDTQRSAELSQPRVPGPIPFPPHPGQDVDSRTQAHV
jgi:glycosyltransferase involved in cell wall biosynthesis